MSGALDVMSGLVMPDGRRWGEVAHPHQWGDARAVLDGGSPRRHWLGRARGWSKTSDTAGMLLGLMLGGDLGAGARLYGAAGDKDQGQLLKDAFTGYVRRTPEIQGALEIQASKIVARRTGTFLEILSADASTSWGLTPDVIVVDEFCQWADTQNGRVLWESLTTSIPKKRGSRLIVISTAGQPGSWQHAEYLTALSDPAWRVSEVCEPPPWIDPAEVEIERRRLPDGAFRRWWLNQWVASEDRLVRPEDLLACRTIHPFPVPAIKGKRYVIALDIGLKRDSTVAMVMHAEGRGKVEEGASPFTACVDAKAKWTGTRTQPVDLGEVEGWLYQAHREYNKAAMIVDPYQAALLSKRLRDRGVTVDEHIFSQASVGRLAARLLIAFRDRAMALPADDDDLANEIQNVQFRETSPGVYRMDHSASGHDDQAVTLALGVHALAEAWGRHRTINLDDFAIREANQDFKKGSYWRPRDTHAA